MESIRALIQFAVLCGLIYEIVLIVKCLQNGAGV